MKSDSTDNQGQRLNSDQIIQQAEGIVENLKGLRQNDAIAILSAGIYMIALEQAPPEKVLKNSYFGFNPHLRRVRPGGNCIIDNDLEIKEYIHNLDRYLPLNDLRDELVKKFGESRAPSRSSIGRYLQKIGMSHK
jgi:hypothetical protein